MRKVERMLTLLVLDGLYAPLDWIMYVSCLLSLNFVSDASYVYSRFEVE